MTNDTAMTKQESEVMIEQLKKVFEVVRLLDVDTLEMGNLKGVEDVDGFPCKCYDFWKKGTRCKNCTSREALQKKEKVLKLEYLNSNIYQVISKYIEIDGKPYVIELINAMKSDAIMDDDGRTESSSNSFQAIIGNYIQMRLPESTTDAITKNESKILI